MAAALGHPAVISAAVPPAKMFVQVGRIKAAHLQPSVRADAQDVPFGQADDLLAVRQKTAPGKGFFQDVGRAGITDQTAFKPVDAKRTVSLDQIQMIELIEDRQGE